MKRAKPSRVPGWIPALFLASTLVPMAPVSAKELWRADPDPEACRFVLVNELGGVIVETTGERILVSSDVPGLAVEATRGEGGVTLAVSSPDPETAGDVTLRVPIRCQVAVRTDRGPVEVALDSEPATLAIETVTGPITAHVDPLSPVTIALATSGEITTDFSIDIEFKYHQEPAKFGTVSVANGGGTVRLTSRQGAVRVLRHTNTRP